MSSTNLFSFHRLQAPHGWPSHLGHYRPPQRPHQAGGEGSVFPTTNGAPKRFRRRSSKVVGFFFKGFYGVFWGASRVLAMGQNDLFGAGRASGRPNLCQQRRVSDKFPSKRSNHFIMFFYH